MIVAADATIIVGPIIAAVLAPLLAFYFARRAHSGELRSTEAGQLWEESRSVRGELRHDVDELQARVASLLDSNEELRVRIVQLEHEQAALKRANEKLTAENVRLRAIADGGTSKPDGGA